jgi:quercetin dioxygenase-like cupin family protein
MINVKELTLAEDNEIDWEDLGNGVCRKIMSYNEQIMLVKVAFEKGSIGALHHHPHLQMSYIALGEFEVRIGNDVKILKEGDVYFAPSGVEHGVVCRQAGMLVDVFSPMREDFIR